MNYPPNTTHWNIGDLVLHDYDAKTPRMLMRVIGYMESGECETEYLDKELRKEWGKHKRNGRLFNDVKFLHDPAKFGVKVQVPA